MQRHPGQALHDGRGGVVKEIRMMEAAQEKEGRSRMAM